MNNPVRCALFVLMVASVAVAYSNIDAGKVKVAAAAKPVKIDGVMDQEEWSDALRQEMTGGGEVFLKADGEHLFVGVRGLKEGWGHLYIWGADAVYIFHASAALGTAIYRRDSEKWNPAQSFSWTLRGTTQSEEAREEFLKSFKWLANNNRTGSRRELEFKVARNILTSDPRIAVAYASNAGSPQFWPSTLKDDCLKQELVYGNTPSGLSFNKSLWAHLDLKPSDR